MITFNGQILGDNIVLIQSEETTDTFALVVLTNPCTGATKTAILNLNNCDGNYELNFFGTSQPYEDLLAGLIYYGTPGTWAACIYSQDNDTNTNPDNANFIDCIDLQIII